MWRKGLQISLVFLFSASMVWSADVVINEFDTNTSSAEYLELYNMTGADIDLGAGVYSLVFYNGSGDVQYQTTDLSGTIPANGFFVLAEAGVTDIGGYTPDQNAIWTSFQNGPDAVALVANGTQVDAIIYGSAADTGLEALLSLPGILIPAEAGGSSSRITDGQGDATYANSDWQITATRTPGATNVAAPPTYTPYTIVEIQTPGTDGDASQHVGETVETTGIVTALGSYFYFIQDGDADYSGIYVYNSPGTLALGDEVTLQGTITEYFGLTELGSIASTVVNSTGNALPALRVLTTGAVAAEVNEGVLVMISGTCTAVSSAPGTDYWQNQVDDGSGIAYTDDGIYSATAIVGHDYEITGPVTFYHNNFEILPRDANDVVDVTPPVIPPDEYVFLDFETGTGSFWAPTGSGSTLGLEATSSFATSADYAHTGVQSGKLIFNAADDATPGWFVRLYDPVPDHVLPTSRVGMWIMATTPGAQFRFMMKDIGAGGDAHYEGGPWFDLNGTAGEWQFVSFDLINDVHTAFVNTDGSFSSTDFVGLTSLQFQATTNDTMVIYVDDISEYPAESQTVLNDFESSTGTWWNPSQSGSTVGLTTGTIAVSTEAAYTGASSGKLDLVAAIDGTEGWYARLYNPSPSQIPVYERVGFWVKGTNTDVRARIVLKDTGSGGDNHYEGGPWVYLTADTNWQFISFDPLRDTYTSFVNSDFSFSASDIMTLTGIHFESSSNTDAVIYVDDISHFSTISTIPYADVTLKAQIGGDAQYRSFWANGSWDATGVYDSNWSGPMVELTDPENDGIFEGTVSLVADGTTYNWWVGSENDGNSWLENGADVTLSATDPVASDICVVDPGDAGYNDWIVTLVGTVNGWNNADDNLTRIGDTWTTTLSLTGGSLYEYKYAVMHSWTATYGDGAIGSGGGNYAYTPSQDGSYTFTFNDADNSVSVEAAFTWPLVETFTDSVFDQNWLFNVAGGAGAITIADSMLSGWGSDVGVYTDEGYTGIAYIDNVLGPDWSVSSDIYLVGPADPLAPLYQGISTKTDATDLQYYRFVYRNSSASSNGQLKFQGFDGASWHISAAWNPGVDFDAIETGWHNLKTTVVGNDFFLFLDGKMLPGCPLHDAAPFMDAGYPGAFVYNTANGQMVFDNFTVEPGAYPPMANAGADQFVLINSEVTLNGSIQNALEGNTASWTQISGPTATLSDPAMLTPTFTPTEAGDYGFALTVDAGPDFGHSDQVMVSVNADFIVPQYTVNYAGDVRGTTIDPGTGAIFTSNTNARAIHYFAPGNETGTPDDTLLWAGINGWLGPYGLDMADDGYLYLATYSSGNHVWRFDAYGSDPQSIYTHTGSSRGLTVRGGGTATEVYLMADGGDIVKIIPTGGDVWTATTLFNAGDNASLAVIGNDLYTVNFSDSISKWSDLGSGYVNVPFHTNIDLHKAQVVRPGADANSMYVMYSVLNPDSSAGYYDTYIGALDLSTGELAYSIQLNDETNYLYSWARPYTMDVTDGYNIAWGVGPTGNNAVYPAYPQGTYRGYLFDTTGDPGNRAPGARVALKPGPEVIFGSTVDIYGNRSGDIDGDAITYAWTQTAGPTVAGLDLTAANLSFQALQIGDYVFQLVVSDGVNASTPAEVSFSVLPVTFVEDFSTDADVENWTVFNDANMTVSINDSMGIGDSGALDLASNLGFAASGFTRGLYAQPGEYFTLDVWVKFVSSNGSAPTSLTLSLDGLTPTPMVVDLNQADFLGQYGHVVLDGFATAQAGNLTIAGVLPFAPGMYQHIYLDNLGWSNPAIVTTYTLSGTITTSDAGDPTGADIQVAPYNAFWNDQVADNTGAYSIPGIVPGDYIVKAMLFGYKYLDTLVTVDADLTLDLTLIRNTPPVAVAPTVPASNQMNAFVVFDGSGCYDADGDALAYHWMGPDTIPIQLFHSGNAGFRPTTLGTFDFSLYVTDGVDTSETVTFSVNVDQTAPAPERPFTFVDEFSGDLQGWQGLAIDAQSKLWSISYYGGTSGIRVWDADGVHSRINNIPYVVLNGDTLPLNTNNHGRDAGVDHLGNVWVSGAGFVAGFNPETGEQIGAIAPEPGVGSPVFSFDNTGALYVGAVVGHVIYKYNSNLELIQTDTLSWGGIGRDFAASPDGSHIFVGELSNKVYVLERQPDGRYLQVDDLAGPFKAGEEISRVKFDSDGFLYLVGSTTNIAGDDRVYIYSPTTGYATREVYQLTGTNSPRGIAFDANMGVMYIADFATADVPIGRYALAGASLITSLATAASDDAVGAPALSDSIVTIRGYVTTTSELGGPAYIQAWDGSAGMAVYDSDFHNAEDLARGQYVEVTGSVGFYSGLTEITNVAVDGWSILTSDLPAIAPKVVTAASLLDGAGEPLEGVLVRIDSLSLVDPGEWPATGSHASVRVTDGVDTIVVRIDRDTNIDGTGAPADNFFSVTGVVSQYDGTSPYFEGYQLMPRDIEDFNGSVVSIDDNLGLPKDFALHQNYPNPFNASTTIKYELPRDAQIKLVIYNLLGQHVATLIDEHQTAGYRTIRWNGVNDFGQNVASGLYIMRITADKNAFTQVRKLTIIK